MKYCKTHQVLSSINSITGILPSSEKNENLHIFVMFWVDSTGKKGQVQNKFITTEILDRCYLYSLKKIKLRSKNIKHIPEHLYYFFAVVVATVVAVLAVVLVVELCGQR